MAEVLYCLEKHFNVRSDICGSLCMFLENHNTTNYFFALLYLSLEALLKREC